MLHSGLKELLIKKIEPIYSSGDKTLDELLSSGFQKDLIYLLFGDRIILALILQKTAVYSFRDRKFEMKVAYIDGNNRFNPYEISKLAVSESLSPKKVLESILISRSFTFEQMVEVLENKLQELTDIKIIMISGITALWPDYEQKTFEGLLKAISGIKNMIHKQNPLIILTAPIHECPEVKPKGGKYLQHFGTVLISILNKERYYEYSLIQHPSKPEKQLRRWIPLRMKRPLPGFIKNTTLDQWF